MTKIIDPDNLTRSTTLGNLGVNGNIFIDTTTKLISIDQHGILDTDGVSLQAVYSFMKEEWKNDNTLFKFEFPFVSITEESFELVNGWDFADTTTKNLLRDGGWALKNTSGVSEEEYANITTLGAFNDSNADQAYYLQVADGTPTPVVLTGEVNQAVKIYGDASHGNFDYRGTFEIYLREQGKTYDSYDLLVEQTLSGLTYKKYAMPLSNATDLKISASDNDIETTLPYTGMSITYGATTRDISGNTYNFGVIVDGNGGTAEEIYEFVQHSLRQTTDIDDGAGTQRGDIADAMLEFVGDTLETKLTVDGGVYIDNFQAVDTNRLVFTDDTGTKRTFDFVSAGKITFNSNLVDDVDAIYALYFTNANGNEYGTANAIVVNDNSGTPISGSVGGNSEISFDFDYDNNVQGGRTAGTDAAVTLVATGLSTGQFATIEGTLTRSAANNISIVSSLERNYSNPA